MLEKWKKAVVHLECATSSQSIHDYMTRQQELRDSVSKGEITEEEFSKHESVGRRDVRFHGTALFISHENRRYLLTARHVLWNEIEAKRTLEAAYQQTQLTHDGIREALLKNAHINAQNEIFNIIFRVPSIDEVAAGKSMPEFLMNLGAGSIQTKPYTFSDPSLDLALISLDQRDSRFADELLQNGFEPISSDDIAEGPKAEGQELLAIGFPSATALLGQVDQHLSQKPWSSDRYSLPVSSFGRVSMLHPLLPFYWADVSIYPGNSGGPVVANDRLIGIVSAQAILPIDDVPHVYTRIPFGRIIKTSYVRELLIEQCRKDQYLNR